jgi:2-phosphosulfolactate phosphatase
MKIDVIPVFGKVLSSHVSSCTAIVVDVLRSTSCIITAVGNGANKIVPATDPGEAAMLASILGIKETVLAGERDAIKLPDFDIGNSPYEYTKEVVKDRNVVISTSNGTAAIHGMSAAKDVLIGGMINRTAVAKKAVELGNDIIIVCSGTAGQISADDLLCAGSIAEAINRLSREPIEATDITMVCCMLYADWKQGRADLSVTKHCARLIKLGFEQDIKYCFSEDTTDIVPVYENGIIR